MRETSSDRACDSECNAVKSDLKREYVISRIMGNSTAVRRLRNQIENIALCDVTVLIIGESGTGKELAARAIHYLSRRANKTFSPVNCGGIPEGLFENEIFGHVKGAYTNAIFAQKGCVKEAEGGTLFLDEIGAISPSVQVKLLRLLENREYRPLGDSTLHRADIRVIAASNRDLLSLVRDGAFREDLFYRLNIVPLYIPPLRDRKEDIPLLINHFLLKYSREYNRPGKALSKELVDVLIAHDWPGNIRELENRIQQLIVMATTDVIGPDSVRDLVVETSSHKAVSLQAAKREAIHMFEKQYLANLLSEHRGNVAAAAKSAGKNRTALWNLIKKYDLYPKQFR